MTVIRRRPAAVNAPVAPPPVVVLGVACEHCMRPLGEPWKNGKVRLPSASFVRPDGQLETRCEHCQRYTALPYQRTA